ncbi:hypothetical protein PFISCL1PPCAC_13432, partial [Pristionchus fissidentatus]
VAGVLMSMLLLYLIRRFTRASLGTYKQLLTIFATYDLFLIVLHAIVQPVTKGEKCNNHRKQCSIKNANYPSSVSLVNSSLLDCCGLVFVMKRWSVRHPHLIPLFSSTKFILAVTSLPVTEMILWYHIAQYGTTGGLYDVGTVVVREEYARQYGKTIMDGWLVMDHWRDGRFELQLFITIVVVNIVMISCFTITITLATLTYLCIKQSDKMSAQSRNLQFKLLIAVSAQTFVPLFFVYIPYACAIDGPFFRIPVAFIGNICMTFTACFPVWDAVIIIVLMRDY